MTALAFAGTATSSKTYTYQLTDSSTTTISLLPEIYSVEYLKGYVGEVSIKYGLSGQQYQDMMNIVTCESNWNVLAFNDLGNSYGVAQYQPTTFKENCSGDYKDPVAQLNCMAQMIKRGMIERWDCFRLVSP